ncbi:hypothetical protein PVAG01_06688 [Phlyctema vagabunda]|uniref:Uncharacterized protein n=1 Tax=Phlyctema vagabunda TaxID=108571 RepID=A0ABR4PGR9_9HELO
MAPITRFSTALLRSSTSLSAPLLRNAASKRSFSLGSHVFESVTNVKNAAKPDWGRQLRHVGDVSKFYFPFFGFFLGWVFVAEKAVDGHL